MYGISAIGLAAAKDIFTTHTAKFNNYSKRRAGLFGVRAEMSRWSPAWAPCTRGRRKDAG